MLGYGNVSDLKPPYNETELRRKPALAAEFRPRCGILAAELMVVAGRKLRR
jgi:hypothetical protein